MAKIYRFTLSNSSGEIVSSYLENKLNENKTIIRSAIDIEGFKKSICILVDDNKQDDSTIQNQLRTVIESAGVQCETILEPIETLPYFDDELNETIVEENRDPSKKIKTKTHRHKHKHEHNHGRKAAIGIIWGGALFVVSFFTLNIPAIVYYCTTTITGIMTLVLGKDIYISAAKKLVKDKKLSMSALYTISTLTILGISIASYFIPGLPLMSESATLILGFWHAGEAIEHLLKKKVTARSKMQDLAPKKVLLAKTKQSISIKKLIPNDIIIIKGGEIIPVDVVALVPIKLFSKEVNGSPDRKLFEPGKTILAGHQLPIQIESLEVRVIKTFQNSDLARRQAAMDAALKKKASEKKNKKNKLSIEQITSTILKYFVPGLLGVALISGIAIGVLVNPALAIQCGISVLVSACPCALKLVKPLADKAGMKIARKRGIQFQTAEDLHAAADIDTVVFDLNHTLTLGKSEVKDHEIFDKTFEEKFFQYITLLEKDANHLIAPSILKYASNYNFSHLPDLKVSNKTKIVSGIKATIDGEEFMIGNKDMKGVDINPADLYPIGTTVFLVRVRDNKVIGRMAVFDPLRSDAVQSINALKALGKEIHICTGDSQSAAIYYAKELGISNKNICASCSAISKSAYIESLKKTHNVMMVGDGSNDLNAFITANVATLIESDASEKIVEDEAGIIIKNSSLMSVVASIDIAQRTTRTIWQSLMVSLTYNTTVTLIAGGLLLGLGFALNPAFGIILMFIETAIVLMNVYLFSISDDKIPEQGPQEKPPISPISIQKMLASHDPTYEKAPNSTYKESEEHHHIHKGWRRFFVSPIRTDSDACDQTCEFDHGSGSPSSCSP